MPTTLSEKIMFYVVYYQESILLFIVYTSSVLYCFKDKLELYETKTDFKKSNNVNLTHSFESFLG